MFCLHYTYKILLDFLFCNTWIYILLMMKPRNDFDILNYFVSQNFFPLFFSITFLTLNIVYYGLSSLTHIIWSVYGMSIKRFFGNSRDFKLTFFLFLIIYLTIYIIWTILVGLLFSLISLYISIMSTKNRISSSWKTKKHPQMNVLKSVKFCFIHCFYVFYNIS